MSPELPATPSFVVDQPTLGRFCDRFEAALATHWPNSIVAYSFKTNSLPWLVGYMRERGAWAEVVSDTEYELALALGYTPDRIVFNGPVKGRERLRAALVEGSVVNLDSHREVRWASELARERPDRELAVGLRVNWDLEARCPGESATPDEGDASASASTAVSSTTRSRPCATPVCEWRDSTSTSAPRRGASPCSRRRRRSRASSSR